jgi:hypothetical protein
MRYKRLLGRYKAPSFTPTGLASWGFTSTGWTTFGITPTLGAVPAGVYLQIGSLTTQTDVLATHADGSIKHALVTASIPSISTLNVATSAGGPGAAFTPSNWPTCVVDMTIESTSLSGTPGDVYRSSLPAYATTDRTCSGSQLQETHYRVTPARVSDSAAHPFLRVKFSVRSYSDGQHEVSVIGENIQVNNASPTARSVDYRIQITFNGAGVLDQHQRVAPFTVGVNGAGSTFFTTSTTHNLTTGDCVKITSGLDSGEVRVVISCPTTTQFTALYDLYNTTVAGSPVSGLSCTVIGHRHWAGCRWVQRYYTSGYVESHQTIDVDHYVTGHAFLKYNGTAHANIWPGTNPGAGPFGPGNWRLMDPNGPNPGKRNDIGLMPAHVVSYLANPSNQTLRDQVIQEGDLSGSYQIHWGVDDTHDLISLDTYPNFQSHAYRDFTNGGAGIAQEVDTTWYGGLPQGMFGVDVAHMPQPSHAAYILTGRRYYADETKHIANSMMLSTYDGGGSPGYASRGGSAGYVGESANGARGTAWSIRNLLCCYWLPDADPYKSYFDTRIATNLSVMNTYATDSSATNALGMFFYESFYPNIYGLPSATDAYILTAPWMIWYMAYVDLWAKQLYPSHNAVAMDRAAKIAMAMYDEPTWDVDHRAPYNFLTKYSTNSGASFSFFTSYANAYTAMVNLAAAGNNPFGLPMTQYYGPHVRIGYIIAKKLGLPNAAAALAWIDAYDNHGLDPTVLAIMDTDIGIMSLAIHEDQ